MSMPDAVNSHRIYRSVFIIGIHKEFISFFYRSKELSGMGSGKVNPVYSLCKNLKSLNLLQVIIFQKICCFKWNCKIIIKLCYLFFIGSDFQMKEISASRTVGIGIKCQLMCFALFCMVCHNKILMIHIHGSGMLSVKKYHNLRIVCIPDIGRSRV